MIKEETMDSKLEQTAAAVGRHPDVVEKLDELLAGPNDRAFVICQFDDCQSNVKGRCTVYAVQGVPKMKPNTHCESYERKTNAGQDIAS